jgi:hypothetical protein
MHNTRVYIFLSACTVFYARTATIEDGEHLEGSTTNYEQQIEMSIQSSAVRATDVAMCKHPPVMTQGPKGTPIWMSLHIE